MAKDNGFIDLGQKPEPMDGKPSEAPKVHYPTMFITHKMDGGSDGLDSLPDGEFEFTGKGQVVSYKEDKKTGTCQCEIEIMAIKPEGEAPKKKGKSSEDNLDEALNKIAAEKGKSDPGEADEDPEEEASETPEEEDAEKATE